MQEKTTRRSTPVQKWTDKAEHDFLNIANNLQAHEIPWDTVCFHSQQAAEKYLKAVLADQGIDPPYTHDLVLLAEMLGDWIPLLAKHRKELAWLSRLSVEPRYPEEEDLEIGVREGRKAHRIAGQVKRLCLAHLRSQSKAGKKSKS